MRISLLVLATIIGISSPAQADYFDGLRYWDKGRFGEAIAEWRSAAADGDRQAMFHLGTVYAAGDRVDQDYVEAHRWLSRAYERGHPDANRGILALEARMTQQEIAEARNLTTRPPPASRHPLHEITRRGDVDGLQQLLASGVDVNQRSKEGMTALMLAVSKGFVLLVEHLLAARADPNVRAPTGATALYLAAENGHAEIAALLIDAGADPTIKGPKGQTPARLAWNSRDGAVLQALGPAGAPSQTRVRAARDLLYQLHYLNRSTRVDWNEVESGYMEWLVDHDHDQTEPLTPEQLNKLKADLAELQERQAERGCAKLCTEEWLKTARVEDVIAELRDGADIMSRNRSGNTPLHLSVRHGIQLLNRLFLARGSPHDTTNSRGETPLHWATRSPNSNESALLLLADGANPDTRDSEGATPLHWAAGYSNDPGLLALLLDYGSNIKARTDQGSTPLHIAVAQNANPELVRLLLDRGVEVNDPDSLRVTGSGKKARNTGQDTALHLAARGTTNPETISLLLDRGADLEIQNA